MRDDPAAIRQDARELLRRAGERGAAAVVDDRETKIRIAGLISAQRRRRLDMTGPVRLSLQRVLDHLDRVELRPDSVGLGRREAQIGDEDRHARPDEKQDDQLGQRDGEHEAREQRRASHFAFRSVNR